MSDDGRDLDLLTESERQDLLAAIRTGAWDDQFTQDVLSSIRSRKAATAQPAQASTMPNVPSLVPLFFNADQRGYFLEVFSSQAVPINIVNVFTVYNLAYVVRGLHMQSGAVGQGKLVTCTQGRIRDIAIDADPRSVRFGKMYQFEIAGPNPDTQTFGVWVPPNFLHGYEVLGKKPAVVTYMLTAPYDPRAEIVVDIYDHAFDLSLPYADQVIRSSKDSAGLSWKAFCSKYGKRANDVSG